MAALTLDSPGPARYFHAGPQDAGRLIPGGTMRRLTTLLLALLAACSRGPTLGDPVTVARANAANPTVAVDSATGRVYVAWVQQAADSGWDVYLAGGTGTGAFDAPVRVNDRPGEAMVATENPPQVVVTGDGGVVVAWVTSLRPDSAVVADISVRLARSDDQGRSFGPVATFAGAPTGLSRANMYYDLAAGPGGTLYLSWLDLHWYTDTVAHRTLHHVPDSVPVPEDRVEFRVAASHDGGRSFSAGVVLDTVSCICCRTAVASGPDGRVHALWRHVFDGSVRDFLAAASEDGAATFAPPVRVHQDGWVLNGCPDTGGDLVVDGSGVVHAAWYTGAPDRVGLWYARGDGPAGAFAAPVRLLPTGHLPPAHVKLTASGTTVWGIWEDRRVAPAELRFGTPGAGAGRSLGAGEAPAIAAAGGRLAVAYARDGAVLVRAATVPREPS